MNPNTNEMSTTTKLVLNRQIAEIAGKCACENPLGDVFLEMPCRRCGKQDRSDYLAPENWHELIRIVTEMEVAITMEKWHGKIWTVMMAVDGREGLIATHSTDLSIALAEAIIEARG